MKKYPTKKIIVYLDAAMSRSGLGWRNASAVAAATRKIRPLGGAGRLE